jgi:hypothetical protein
MAYYGKPRMTGDLDMDRVYLERWAARLGVADALAELMR